MEVEVRPAWEKWVYRFCFGMVVYPAIVVGLVGLSVVEFWIAEGRLPVSDRDNQQIHESATSGLAEYLVFQPPILVWLILICLTICVWIDLSRGSRWWLPIAAFWSSIALLFVFVLLDPLGTTGRWFS